MQSITIPLTTFPVLCLLSLWIIHPYVYLPLPFTRFAHSPTPYPPHRDLLNAHIMLYPCLKSLLVIAFKMKLKVLLAFVRRSHKFCPQPISLSTLLTHSCSQVLFHPWDVSSCPSAMSLPSLAPPPKAY